MGNNGKLRYQQAATRISTYKPRRERIRKLYGSYSLEYRKINNKITNAAVALNRIKKRNNYMREVEEYIREFIGYKVRDIPPTSREVEKCWCRQIFFKYCIERGISGYDIAKFIRCHRFTPTVCRRKFTKSFKAKPENLEIWRRFKLFIKDKQEIK